LLNNKNEFAEGQPMKKSCLFGLFYACVITFVSASANVAEAVAQNTSKYGAEDIPLNKIVTGVYQANLNRNNTLSSGLLDTLFMISCGVIGIFLLHKTNLSLALIVRQRGSRRFDLLVEFPLTDSQGLLVVKDRRRLPERRKAKHGIYDLIAGQMHND
jgi:hypothetical protein